MNDPSEPSEKPDTPGPSAENPAPLAPQSSLATSPPTDDGTGADGSAQPSPSDGSGVANEAVAEEGPVAGDPSAGSAPPGDASQGGGEVHAVPVALTHEQIELIRKRRKDKTIGLVIVSGTFIVSMIGSLWAKKLAEPELSEPPGPPTTVGVDNWPKAVDAIQALPVARAATRRNLFRGFVAEQVKSDGTMDFSRQGRRVRYSFQSEPGHGPQPPRKPETQPRRTYCGKQNVHMGDVGVVADPDMASYPCPTKEKEALPDPGCSLKQVWDHALAKGAPKKKPARIEYYLAEAGPAYRFNLPGTKHRFSLSADCSRELSGRDAIGGVP